MISLLARFFCKSDGKSPAQLRTAYGILCGAVGIGLNLLLFLGKFFAGTLSGSVAITADAFNNLSDAGSSVVTLLGFRIAAKAPDPGHPFGHGRAEYLSGLAVSMLILLMGVELAKESLNMILHPALVDFSWLVIVILAVFHIDYQSYANGADLLSYLLTPATVCLAIPLYKQLELLRQHLIAVASAIVAGVAGSVGSIYVMCRFFRLEHTHYVTLLPKSITTAIGMGVSEEAGGIVTLTVISIIITGILGNIIADWLFQIFKIEEPIAKGLALGTAAHAIGTAKALELGEIEGAMSSLSIAVAGLLTVVVVPLMSGLI